MSELASVVEMSCELVMYKGCSLSIVDLEGGAWRVSEGSDINGRGHPELDRCEELAQCFEKQLDRTTRTSSQVCRPQVRKTLGFPMTLQLLLERGTIGCHPRGMGKLSTLRR